MLTSEQIDELTQISKFTPKEIRRLYKRFRRLDINSDGHISHEEFLKLPELATNPLKDRILVLFDNNTEDSVSFKSFISTLNIFSSRADKSEKLKAAFKIYDVDGDGLISPADLTQIVKLLVGETLSETQIEQVVTKTISESDFDSDGLLNFEEFAKTMNVVDFESKFSIRF
ncbi:hypothetical protein P9112_011207 [Eukaryota sp. TZLM1-RC]